MAQMGGLMEEDVDDALARELHTGFDDSVFIKSTYQRWRNLAQIRPAAVKWWQLLEVGPITTH